jgi:hypothetical protein
MRTFSLFVIFLILSACSNVNSKAIEYREVHVEKRGSPLLLGHSESNVDVTQGEKIVKINHHKKFDFLYDKKVG